MIIDIHTHIFPKAVIKDRGAYAAQDPSFAVIYSNPKARMITAEEMVERMDKEGISKSVVCNYPWEHNKLCKMCNDYLLENIDKYPDRLIAFICIQAKAGNESIKELERCFAAGAQGVGEMGYYTTGITKSHLKSLVPIAEAMREYQKVIMLHTNEPVGHQYPGKSEMTLKQIYEFIEIFQDTKLILAHWGGGFFVYTLIPEIERLTRNVYYDTAASPFLYDNRIYKCAVDIVGPHKILFGSDAPLLGLKKYTDGMAEAGLSQQNIDMILGKNAQHLLELDT